MLWQEANKFMNIDSMRTGITTSRNRGNAGRLAVSETFTRHLASINGNEHIMYFMWPTTNGQVSNKNDNKTSIMPCAVHFINFH